MKTRLWEGHGDGAPINAVDAVPTAFAQPPVGHKACVLQLPPRRLERVFNEVRRVAELGDGGVYLVAWATGEPYLQGAQRRVQGLGVAAQMRSPQAREQPQTVRSTACPADTFTFVQIAREP